MDESKPLKSLQEAQVDILLNIDAFCQKHHIDYSLYAGSLLGAVRHQDFIPWDDDLDICMSRAEYNRFLTAWKRDPVEGYILQNKDTQPNFTQSFTKIRKDHTTFLQYEWEAGRYHTGIFVDIFPVDRIPNGTIERLFFWWRCMRYQLYTREFPPTQNGTFIKWISKWLLFCTPPKKRAEKRSRLLKQITKRDEDAALPVVMIETMRAMRQVYSSQLLSRYTELLFHGHKVKCFAAWDSYLKQKYGNYLELPPKEERIWKHHPLILDFEHNLEERSE